MRRARWALALASLLAIGAAQADFTAGILAIGRRDFEAAFKAFKPLAEQGNAAAQVNLGNLYMKGLGVEQNYPLALFWYRRAAEQGERVAQSKLGILYYHGLGANKDPAEAARWFQKAADQGVVSAQAILGSLYAEGDGVPKEPAKAYYWYMLAEEQGDVEAAKGRKSLEEELTPGQRDEALKLLAELRRIRTEQDEQAFEAATAGLGAPPADAAAQPPPAKAKAGKRKARKHAR